MSIIYLKINFLIFTLILVGMVQMHQNTSIDGGGLKASIRDNFDEGSQLFANSFIGKIDQKVKGCWESLLN